MRQISQKRQAELVDDAFIVRKLYAHACEQWGQEKVDADHTRLWDLRCIWGMKGILPFGSTVSKNLGEVLYVAETVCGYVQTPWEPKAKRGKE